MDAHDSDVCVNVVGKSLEAVRLLLRLDLHGVLNPVWKHRI